MDTSNQTQETSAQSNTGYIEKVQETEKPVEQGGKQYDDLGYEITPEIKKEPVVEEDKPDAPKEESEVVEDPSTGYGDAPAKEGEETKPPEETPAEEVEKEDDKEQVEVDLGDTKGLLESEVEGLKKLAIDNKLSPEATKALVQYKKDEVARLDKILKDRQESFKQKELETKKAWLQELKEDPTFGGEAFSKNVMKVEKFLKDFMPGIKKELTKAGTMLPPYVMRDFYNVAEKLYGTKRFVQGEVQEKELEKTDDPLDFYT